MGSGRQRGGVVMEPPDLTEHAERFTRRHPAVPAWRCYCIPEEGRKCGECHDAGMAELASLEARDE